MPKKTAAKKKTLAKMEPTFIREIELKFKKRRVKHELAGVPLVSAERVAELFRDLQNEAKEKLIAIALDTKLKILCFEIISIGSLNAVYSRPFESVRTTILVNACCFIMVHNHPSGDPTPSQLDEDFTYELAGFGETGGIPLEDHIIIGEGESYYSFAEAGLISKYQADARKRRSLPDRLRIKR